VTGDRSLASPADELRATADQFKVPSARERLRRIAANLDGVADHAGVLLTGKPKAPGGEDGLETPAPRLGKMPRLIQLIVAQ
jgi:hypothetical protein